MIFSYLGGKATMFARKMVKIQHYIEEACKKWITEELNR